MNICRCEEYEKIANNFTFFTFGTLHQLTPRIALPEHKCFQWVCNKATHNDMRFKKLLVKHRGGEIPEEKLTIESKWIPVLPGLISQRLVNESKNPNLKCPY